MNPQSQAATFASANFEILKVQSQTQHAEVHLTEKVDTNTQQAWRIDSVYDLIWFDYIWQSQYLNLIGQQTQSCEYVSKPDDDDGIPTTTTTTTMTAR